jgi:hypothetical protein
VTKLYSKKVENCSSCPYFALNDSFRLPEGWLCIKMGKIIAPLNTVMVNIPDWCPLEEVKQ